MSLPRDFDEEDEHSRADMRDAVRYSLAARYSAYALPDLWMPRPFKVCARCGGARRVPTSMGISMACPECVPGVAR